MMFEEMIKKMEQEIYELKTCPVKTATTMATIQNTQDINIPMTIPIWSGSTPPPYAYGYKQAIITCTSTSGPMICSCHLVNDQGDVTNYNLQGRSISVFPRKCGTVWEFAVLVYSRGSDAQVIWEGGSVSLDYTMEITATSDFTISLDYENYMDGLY